MITREDIYTAIGTAYSGNYELFLDDFEYTDEVTFKECNFICAASNGSGYDGECIIIDTCSHLYLNWYKETHIGRCFKTNIPDTDTLNRFFKNFYDAQRAED
jgi:hypothetical protein